MATKVKLRKKPISGNRESLYLDFYPPIPHPETGEPTRREFLGMYVDKRPKNAIDKIHKEDTLLIAEQKRQKRENELNKPEVYTAFEKSQLKLKALGETSFVEYFKKMADKRKASNHDNWVSALKYLISFTGGEVKFEDLDVKFFESFKEYLLTVRSNKSEKAKLSQNSAVSYFNKIKAALRQAYKEGYLQVDLNARVAPIEQQETWRDSLTVDEFKRLFTTDCNNNLLKRAALFSGLTGLRFSDIQKLTWGEVEEIDGETYLNFRQKKTTNLQANHPITLSARDLMGPEGNPTYKVFDGLTYSAYQNKHLYQWIGAAGITKDITFHSFRHTYITIQLIKGTDPFFVSRLVGHKNPNTIRVYSRKIDPALREAANKMEL